ncbi:MAG: type II toxin-antitoxin system VapC family toxin [Acidobacteria bacterium]|nr:type II toxin-antitoxin system VapC family toxin [Acidobacteriota bacterium]
MKVVDLNVLLYAVNADAPHHERIVAWWERALNGDETIGLAWTVVVGFLRVSTNPTVFPAPLTPEASMAQIDAWLARDVVSLLTETRDHWRVLRDMLSATGVAGNLATDAHLAALAVTHGATLASCDTDFGRFEHLRWENPLRDA